MHQATPSNILWDCEDPVCSFGSRIMRNLVCSSLPGGHKDPCSQRAEPLTPPKDSATPPTQRTIDHPSPPCLDKYSQASSEDPVHLHLMLPTAFRKQYISGKATVEFVAIASSHLVVSTFCHGNVHHTPICLYQKVFLRPSPENVRGRKRTVWRSSIFDHGRQSSNTADGTSYVARFAFTFLPVPGPRTPHSSPIRWGGLSEKRKNTYYEDYGHLFALNNPSPSG